MPGRGQETYIETNVRRDGGKIGTGIGRLGQEWESHRLAWEWEPYGSRVISGPGRG